MIKRNVFQPGKSLDRGENGQEKKRYRIRLEKSLVFTLAITLILFLLFKTRNAKYEIPEYVFSSEMVVNEIMPVTRQAGRQRPPVIPRIPIVSEDEFVHEDVTIDIVDLNLVEGLEAYDIPGQNSSRPMSGPRPLLEVIPEYPDDLRKKGIAGVINLSILVNLAGKVDSVIVLGNSTKNQRLARAAVAAAYKTVYMPLKTRAKNKAFWIKRPIRFEGR